MHMSTALEQYRIESGRAPNADEWARAAHYVRRLPLYRKLYGTRAAEFRFEDASSFPILERASLAGDFPGGWMTETLSELSDAGRVEFATSSGTTGERVQIVRPRDWWSGEHQRAFRHTPALRNFRVGVERKAVLTTMDCSAAVCFAENPRFEDRVIDNILYLNTVHDPNHWSRRDVERMLGELADFQPELLLVNPTFLGMLLQKAELWNLTRTIFKPEVLKLSYETATAFMKKYIARFMRGRTIEMHGTTEVGWLYQREAEGVFERLPEKSFVEFVPFSESRGTYEVLVTSVKNELMPFVRFRIGDVVKLDPQSGRFNTSTVRYFCGRARDAIPDERGEPVTAAEVDEALGQVSCNVLQYQTVVRGPRRLAFRYVTIDPGGLPSSQGRSIVDALRSVFGDVFVELERVRQISPGRSGKFRLVEQP